MNATINKILIGGSGIAGTQITGEVLPTDTTDIAGITQIVVQIIIGIATLFGLFKKKK